MNGIVVLVMGSYYSTQVEPLVVLTFRRKKNFEWE